MKKELSSEIDKELNMKLLTNQSFKLYQRLCDRARDYSLNLYTIQRSCELSDRAFRRYQRRHDQEREQQLLTRDYLRLLIDTDDTIKIINNGGSTRHCYYCNCETWHDHNNDGGRCCALCGTTDNK
jgi:hypothetical protein